MKLTKIDVAERQLRQAIRLFFAEADEVSTHSLACAAHSVLDDLAKANGTPRGLRDHFPTLIRADRVQEVQRAINAPRNFFKHADNDANGSLEFSPELTPMILLDACIIHPGLTAYHMIEAFIFLTWIDLNYPELLLDGPVKDFYESPQVRTLLDGLDAKRRDVFLMVIDDQLKTKSRIPIPGRVAAV